MSDVCRSKAEKNMTRCWVYNLCPKFAEGNSKRYSKKEEKIQTKIMSYVLLINKKKYNATRKNDRKIRKRKNGSKNKRKISF